MVTIQTKNGRAWYLTIQGTVILLTTIGLFRMGRRCSQRRNVAYKCWKLTVAVVTGTGLGAYLHIFFLKFSTLVFPFFVLFEASVLKSEGIVRGRVNRVLVGMVIFLAFQGGLLFNQANSRSSTRSLRAFCAERRFFHWLILHARGETNKDNIKFSDENISLLIQENR